jgi:alpha-2-macroglobulin
MLQVLRNAGLILLIGGLLSVVASAGERESAAEADSLRAEKSYPQAEKIYQELLTEYPNSSATSEWTMKLADCMWRPNRKDNIKAAEKLFNTLLEKQKDKLLAARAHYLLADLYNHWNRHSYRQQFMTHIDKAINYFGGPTDIPMEEARVELIVCLRMKLSNLEQSTWRGDSRLTETYKTLLKISKVPSDREKSLFGLADSYRHTGNVAEATKNFSLFLEEFPNSDNNDDALWHLGEINEQYGHYIDAADAFRKLYERYTEKTSQFDKRAKERWRTIVDQRVTPSINAAYNPGATIELFLNWRNCKSTKIEIYKIDLEKTLPESYKSNSPSDTFLDVNQHDFIRERDGKRVRTIKETLEDKGKHGQYSRRLLLDPLPAGVYLVVTRSNKALGRALLIVSTLGLIERSGHGDYVVFTCDGTTSEPIPECQIYMLESRRLARTKQQRNRYEWYLKRFKTGEDGLLRGRHEGNKDHAVMWIAMHDGQVAFSNGRVHHKRGANWNRKYYGITDKPAYRPHETVNWNIILRDVYYAETTSLVGKMVDVIIRDPKNSEIWKKNIKVDEYGAVSGEYDLGKLGDEPPLGEYKIFVEYRKKGKSWTHAATFRIEEYKLPEFRVSVGVEQKPYLVGDSIVAEVTAEYFFGGPVANANLVYVIKESPHHHYWRPKRTYDWYYDDIYSRPNRWGWRGGGETIIAQETIKTDEEGHARIEWKSNADKGSDLVYKIEVRVTDASRREIVGNGQARVARQMYRLNLDNRKHVYRPLDRAEFNLDVLDANDKPVAATGTVHLYKLRWRDDKRRNEPIELFTDNWQTSDDGKLTYKIHLTDTGYYKVVFKSQPPRGPEVSTETTIWCTTKDAKHLDVKPGRLEIIAEKQEFKVGETARLLVVGFYADTHFLLTRETGEILDAKVIKLSGRSALIELPVTREWVPNIGFVASTIRDNIYNVDREEILVPPESQFLTVEVEPDDENYKPGAKGKFKIKVVDASGEPVQARLAMGVADESVYSIHEEYAPDIRKFFFKDKRRLGVNNYASHQYKSYRSAKDIEKMLKEEKKRKARELLGRDAPDVGRKNYSNLSDLEEFLMGEEKEAPRRSLARARKKSPMKAPPVPSSMPAFGKAMAADMLASVDETPAGAGAGPLKKPTVRADFRSNVFWSPVIETNKKGEAKVDMKYSESLTQWRATARAFTPDTKVGQVVIKTRTRKDVMIRLQAPRFFVERDKVTLSANVHNECDRDLKIKVSIALTAGNTKDESPLQLQGKAERWVEVGAHKQVRVDWKTNVLRPAPVKITVSAESKKDSDAMTKTYPVLVHGARKQLAFVGTFTDSFSFNAQLPEERNPNVSKLRVMVSPSLAGSLFDCLEYLADYPYGCVEQTMSRFLPSAIMARTLERQGMATADFDPKLDDKIRDGLKRLSGFQHDDGGWGWWKNDASNRWMSTYVCFGLLLLKEADYNVDRGMLKRGLDYVRKQILYEENNPDMATFMLYVLQKGGIDDDTTRKLGVMLYEKRDDLKPTALAMLGLYLHDFDKGKSAVVARNLVGFASADSDNNTANWGSSAVVRNWSEAAVEATAFALYALVQIAPEEPVVKQAVRWLVYNRRGNRWKSTRDTAFAVLALSRYLETSNEQASEGDLTLLRDGQKVMTWHIEPKKRIRPIEYTLSEGEFLKGGDNNYEFVWDGKGEIYAFAFLTFFTKEEDIKGSGYEIFVKRRYFKIVPKETLLQGVYETKVEMKPGETIKSGERIEVKIEIESKNNYEYLVFEDYKPSGCEAVAVLSGKSYGICSNMELRDEKVAFFITRLTQGKHSITYKLRAEIPGDFHVLPHNAYAMYVPEIAAISDEGRVSVVD